MGRRADPAVPAIDLRQLPLEPLLARALRESQPEFAGTCSVLTMLAQQGRVDAGVVLLGLLAHFREDAERSVVLIRALRGVASAAVARTLVEELRRVESSNATRGYLNGVLETLTSLPRDLWAHAVQTLAEDRAFSVKWRARFRETLERW